MFVKFLVRKERYWDLNGVIRDQKFLELARFDSYEEAENYIKNYDFPTNGVIIQLSIHKTYTNEN